MGWRPERVDSSGPVCKKGMLRCGVLGKVPERRVRAADFDTSRRRPGMTSSPRRWVRMGTTRGRMVADGRGY